MEIKLRRKGEVIIAWDNFPEYHIPREIMDLCPEGLMGIDLTGYSVIMVRTGKKYRRVLDDIRERAPNVLIVYEYNYRSGFGYGILLPSGFAPEKVKFYKTQAQIDAEQAEITRQANIKKMHALMAEVRANTQFVKVFPGDERDGSVTVVFLSRLSTSSIFEFRANSLAKVKEGIEKRMPFWIWIEAEVLHVVQSSLHITYEDIRYIQISFGRNATFSSVSYSKPRRVDMDIHCRMDEKPENVHSSMFLEEDGTYRLHIWGGK